MKVKTIVNNCISDVINNNKFNNIFVYGSENLELENGKIVTKHGYSVVNIDDDYVYVVNPWNSSKTISYPKEDFIKNVDNFAYVDLNTVKNK